MLWRQDLDGADGVKTVAYLALRDRTAIDHVSLRFDACLSPRSLLGPRACGLWSMLWSGSGWRRSQAQQEAVDT